MLYKKIELCFYRLIIGLYRLNNNTAVKCDAIVPHGYGLTADGDLINATRLMVEKTIETARRFPKATIFLVSTNYWPDERAREEQLKLEMVRRSGIGNRTVLVTAGARNTVDEVRETSRLLHNSNLKNIAVISDVAQERSAKIIWRHYLPTAELHFVGVEAEWKGEHRAFLLKSPLRWLLTNFIRHFLLRVRGVERTGRVAQSFKKA